MSYPGMTQFGDAPDALVVTAEPGLRDEPAADLTGGGHRVTATATGAAAVRVLAGRPAGLVVVDRDAAIRLVEA
ncbi:hypothetical protein [Actinoplanes sp. NPDC020271]|uniref:hypothetical protein n=1 Tax=Actinoplanes sp. NPDC020271 TaxID=3363896 RepID=UPI0037AB9C2B